VTAFDPTPEQRAILNYQPDRHARVLAGPGTGKSATLVALIDRLLDGEPTPRIRLLTFTRAATGELAKKVSGHPAAAAERPSPIHSFSISVLLRNPGAGDYPQPLRIADDWEYKSLIRPTLATRAGVGVKKLDRLVREMAAGGSPSNPKRILTLTLRPAQDSLGHGTSIEASTVTRFWLSCPISSVRL
jgi:superfamily I DNA/RNA helicase